MKENKKNITEDRQYIRSWGKAALYLLLVEPVLSQ
jgi:hypothetical protein